MAIYICTWYVIVHVWARNIVALSLCGGDDITFHMGIGFIYKMIPSSLSRTKLIRMTSGAWR